MHVEMHCLFPSSWSNRQNSASVRNKTPRQAVPTAALCPLSVLHRQNLGHI